MIPRAVPSETFRRAGWRQTLVLRGLLEVPSGSRRTLAGMPHDAPRGVYSERLALGVVVVQRIAQTDEGFGQSKAHESDALETKEIAR